VGSRLAATVSGYDPECMSIFPPLIGGHVGNRTQRVPPHYYHSARRVDREGIEPSPTPCHAQNWWTAGESNSCPQQICINLQTCLYLIRQSESLSGTFGSW